MTYIRNIHFVHYKKQDKGLCLLFNNDTIPRYSRGDSYIPHLFDSVPGTLYLNHPDPRVNEVCVTHTRRLEPVPISESVDRTQVQRGYRELQTELERLGVRRVDNLPRPLS